MTSQQHFLQLRYIYNAVYRKKSFPSKESDTKILQSIYFAYEVGIISSEFIEKFT